MSISNNEPINEMGVRINVSGNLLIIAECHSYCGITSSLQVGGRGAIEKFSESSRSRLKRYLRETRADYKSMVTLTYPADSGFDGRASKEHLRRFLQELRRAGSGNLDRWSAFWFLEFQKRGSIHYHILCTHYYHYEWIARTWARIVDSCDKNHINAGTRIEKIRAGRGGIACYCAKYAAKFDQKLVPESFGFVGRFWGVQGYKERMSAATFVSPSLKGHYWSKNALKRLKSAILGDKLRNITNAVPDLPTRISIFRIPDQKKINKYVKMVRFLEIWCAIEEGREPMFEDQLEELYEEMVEDGVWNIEKEYFNHADEVLQPSKSY